MKPPSNISEVRSVLGLVTYCGKFIPNFATITEPLKQSTRQKTDIVWNEEQESAFIKIKNFNLEAPVLSYFHPAKPKLLLMPASKVWVLFCFKRTLKTACFNQYLFPVIQTQRPDTPKLNEKH